MSGHTVLAYLNTLIRLCALAGVWGSIFAALFFGVGFLIPFIAVVFGVPLAIFLSHHIFRAPLFALEPSVQRKARGSLLPESVSLRELVSLLDEDDLDDLRDEVREGLRERIRRLTDSDAPESFEMLLADTGSKRKRTVR